MICTFCDVLKIQDINRNTLWRPWKTHGRDRTSLVTTPGTTATKKFCSCGLEATPAHFTNIIQISAAISFWEILRARLREVPSLTQQASSQRVQRVTFDRDGRVSVMVSLASIHALWFSSVPVHTPDVLPSQFAHPHCLQRR